MSYYNALFMLGMLDSLDKEKRISELEAKNSATTYQSSSNIYNYIPCSKRNSKTVEEYLKNHDGEDFTVSDISNETKLSIENVNTTIANFQKRGWTIREEVTTNYGKLKFIRLTDEGRQIFL